MVIVALYPLGTEHSPHLYREGSVMFPIQVRGIVPEPGAAGGGRCTSLHDYMSAYSVLVRTSVQRSVQLGSAT